MCEPSHYILLTDRDECLGYDLIERLPRSLSSLPHQVLYLREGLFYGVEVPGEEYAGRNTSSQPLTSMSSLTLFVLCAPRARQAPPPLLRRGSVPEPSLHVSLEELFVGSPLYAHALAHPSFQSDGGDQGLVLASVSRNPAIRSLAFRRPRPEPIHGDRKAAFVDEHQPPCVETGGQPLPQPAFVLVALLCYGRLFLSGQEPGRRAMVRHIVALEIFTPKASSKASQCSSRVRSGCFRAGRVAIRRADLLSRPEGQGWGAVRHPQPPSSSSASALRRAKRRRRPQRPPCDPCRGLRRPTP